MDFIIAFFRDFLDGPVYIFVTVVNSILICSCIGYLGERYLNKHGNNVNKHKVSGKKNLKKGNSHVENSVSLDNVEGSTNNILSKVNTTNTNNSINNTATNMISNAVSQQQSNFYNSNVVNNVSSNNSTFNG